MVYELSEPKRTTKCIPPPGLHCRCSSLLLWGWCADCGVRNKRDSESFTSNSCSGLPPGKIHELAFLWFGLPGWLMIFFCPCIHHQCRAYDSMSMLPCLFRNPLHLFQMQAAQLQMMCLPTQRRCWKLSRNEGSLEHANRLARKPLTGINKSGEAPFWGGVACNLLTALDPITALIRISFFKRLESEDLFWDSILIVHWWLLHRPFLQATQQRRRKQWIWTTEEWSLNIQDENFPTVSPKDL